VGYVTVKSSVSSSSVELSKIRSVKGYEVLDSRGTPTVYVEVETQAGHRGYGYAPSGASTGRREAVELRDGGKRYFGKGVQKCLEAIKTRVEPQLQSLDVADQKEIDAALAGIDGTDNFGSIGANTATAVSIACFRAAASEKGVEPYKIFSAGPHILPTPMLNIINGGKHAGNGLGIQEFMIVPNGSSFMESLRMAVEVYHSLKDVLKSELGAGAINVGDEGGFAPPFTRSRQALDALSRAVKESGYQLGEDIYFAMDAAASSFYADGKYVLDGFQREPDSLLDYYLNVCSEYPIISLEDPFQEDDWGSFASITKALKGVRIIGDDLLVTNPRNVAKAINTGACNGVIVKVNQIGTVSKAVETIELAKTNGWLPIVSHRSGETEDCFISHLATGYSTGAMKSGAPARGERTSKYNELLKIEANDPHTRFDGASVFKV
jgi:enolase